MRMYCRATAPMITARNGTRLTHSRCVCAAVVYHSPLSCGGMAGGGAHARGNMARRVPCSRLHHSISCQGLGHKITELQLNRQNLQHVLGLRKLTASRLDKLGTTKPALEEHRMSHCNSAGGGGRRQQVRKTEHLASTPDPVQRAIKSAAHSFPDSPT